jgi:signal transduction histidine kinase/CheY-like chemotaxis protein
MWKAWHISSRKNPEFVDALSELVRSATRDAIIIIGTVSLAIHFGIVMGPSNRLAVLALPVVMAIVLSCALALWLISKQLLAGQIIWLIGLTASITFAIYYFQQPMLGFLYALLPLLACLTVGWSAGLLTEGLVGLAAWWLVHNTSLPALRPAFALGIALGGGVTGLLGWVGKRSLATVIEWSLGCWQDALRRMEQDRDQRAELKQIQKDLVHANQELSRLSDRLEDMYQVAENARRVKEEFVANVSHELRTPLNMIIGFSEMIIEAPQVYEQELPAALLSDIEAIHLNSQHLSRLVNDVLDLSQIDSGRMALSKDWHSVRDIIEQAVRTVRQLFDAKGLYLETTLPTEDLRAFCDGTRIRQVMLNLLSNASRFTEQGGVRIEVRQDETEIVISVVDTGPGIAPKDQERIFEPFCQLDGSIRRRHGGSGLGLSISKRFVEMHGGKMWLQSPSPSLGVGTTFYFSLPVESSFYTAAGTDDARRWFSPYSEYEYRVRTRQSAAPVPVAVPRFLLVEEGHMLQRLFTGSLDNCEIVPIAGVEDAALELGRSPAHALIVNAPWSGTAPAPISQLSNLPHRTPAITCWVPGEDEAARQLGVVRYLIKPVTRKLLLSTLDNLGTPVESVLVVDDEPDALQLFARMLSSSSPNYRILRAENGQRALQLLCDRQPDVMLLDLIMPGMDGFEVLHAKRENAAIRDIPVVVVSSRDPTGEPIVGNMMTITRGGGLSMRDITACTQAVIEAMSPSE